MHFGFIFILYRNLSTHNQKKFHYISILTSLSSVSLVLIAALTYFEITPFDALYLAATIDISSFIYSNQIIVSSMKRKDDNDLSLPSALKSNKKKKSLKVRFHKQCVKFTHKKRMSIAKPIYVRPVVAPTIRPSTVIKDSQYHLFISVDNILAIFVLVQELDILVSHSLWIVQDIVILRGAVLLLVLLYFSIKSRKGPESEPLFSTESTPTMYDSVQVPVENTVQLIPESLVLETESPPISATWIIGNDDHADNDNSTTVQLETNLLGKFMSNLIYPKTFVEKQGQLISDATQFLASIQPQLNLKMPKKPQFRIATFNVHFWKEPFGNDNKKEIVDEIIPEINPDFLALQEIPYCLDSMKQQELASSLNYSEYVFSDISIKSWLDLGNAVFSRYPIIKKNVLNLGSFRSAISTTIQIKETEIVVVGLHLEVVSEQLRIQQIEKLLEILEPESNVVLVGDFNTWRDGKVVEKILYAGFESSFDILGSPGPNFTCWTGTAIDFIFVKGEIKQSLVASFAYQTGASDHLPIIADFEF
ncbi:hypothetical protein HDV06_001755 [Boothiomyces sp. JEL0866]|nr:hypothetical protein HDV06_001755 [Boothiomyces sp. JEL0866]